MRAHQLDHLHSGGFTLLELLTVVGIISVLAGIGVGYLGRTDNSLLAASTLRGELRAAQLTARAEGVPTQVVVRPGVEGAAATVQSVLLEPIAAFHFEPGRPVLDDRMQADFGGDAVEAGRFGYARRNDDGAKKPLLAWTLPERIADVQDGFVLRLDLHLDRRPEGQARIAEIGTLLEVRLDQELRVETRLRITELGGGDLRARVRSDLPLPLLRWCTLEIGCDGRWLWLRVDGREIARTAARGDPHQERGMALQVSPPDAPVPGAVDEVRLLAFGFAPEQLLPVEMQPLQTYRFTFDARGEPVDAPEIQYVDLDEEDA
ncbi:MAG: Tfp pilus assembly protein FimT/FimU [Planctomycetota bacterium]